MSNRVSDLEDAILKLGMDIKKMNAHPKTKDLPVDDLIEAWFRDNITCAQDLPYIKVIKIFFHQSSMLKRGKGHQKGRYRRSDGSFKGGNYQNLGQSLG